MAKDLQGWDGYGKKFPPGWGGDGKKIHTELKLHPNRNLSASGSWDDEIG